MQRRNITEKQEVYLNMVLSLRKLKQSPYMIQQSHFWIDNQNTETQSHREICILYMPTFRRCTIAMSSEGAQRSADIWTTKDNMADAANRIQSLGGRASHHLIQHKTALGSQSPIDGHEVIPLM